MRRICLILFMLCASLSNIIYSSTEIRPATATEIPAILELDRTVTYEFFKQLFIDAYNLLGLTRDVDQDLEEELESDAQSFPKLAQADSPERLHIAWDTETHAPCGLLVFHLENDEIILDLLLVDAAYRGQGIGKKLVRSIFSVFRDAKKVTVYPMQYNNDTTLKFYEALGFKNFGVGSNEKLNSHGIPYSKIYYHYELNLQQ